MFSPLLIANRTRASDFLASQRERLIVFTRFPEPGQTKSRMIPILGAQGAAQLQRQLTLHTLKYARQFCHLRKTSLEVQFAGGNEQLMRECFGADTQYSPQSNGDLGARLNHAVSAGFANGDEAVVVIGADCPELDDAVLEDAFAALGHHDLVLGPASDGGYYLIGLRKPAPKLFENMPWSGDALLSQTIQKARSIGFSLRLLNSLSDVDRPEDLELWRRVRAKRLAPAGLPALSVIIPALNESAQIAATLDSVLCGTGIEVIIVDGGSRDDTAQIARAYGITVLQSAPGRASQMNYGARAASGNTLLFLHADSRLPPDYLENVERVLTRHDVVAGAFRLRIDSPRMSLRLVEYFINLRSRLLQMPYGDQALFMKTEIFHAMGGFPAFPVMEDFEFVRRLRKKGHIGIADAPCETSARRWDTQGVFRTTALNQISVIGYLMGASPERIARWR